MFSREKQMTHPLESPTNSFVPACIMILKLQCVDTIYQNWSKEVNCCPDYQKPHHLYGLSKSYTYKQYESD